MKYCPECKSELEWCQVDGIERHSCSSASCQFVVWDNPVPVVAGLVIYKEQVLLARNVAWPEKNFSIITGYLERFESPEDAVAREVKEELGLDVTQVDFTGHYPFKDKNQLIIAFVVTGEGEVALNHEISDTRAIDIDALPGYDFGEFKLTRDIVDGWSDKFSKV